MEKISSGLTWTEVEALFDADDVYSLSLELRGRRSSLKARKQGPAETRKVWRLIVQKDHKNFVRTALRMNIKTDDEGLKSEVVTEKVINKLNHIVG